MCSLGNMNKSPNFVPSQGRAQAPISPIESYLGNLVGINNPSIITPGDPTRSGGFETTMASTVLISWYS